MMDAVECSVGMVRRANAALSSGQCFCCEGGCESPNFTNCATYRHDAAGQTAMFGPLTSLHDIPTSKFQIKRLFPNKAAIARRLQRTAGL